MNSLNLDALNPSRVARQYVETLQLEIKSLAEHNNTLINVVGLIASDDQPSIAYARATKQRFIDIGMGYELREVRRLDLESEINALNANPNVHGIFIYFPVFFNQQDDYLRNLVDFRKDIEAGGSYWTRKLYANDRTAMSSAINSTAKNGASEKAVLPCTPLAIVKMLTEIGIYDEAIDKPINNKVVSIFNRSEVIGRPLAVMMSNDGASVYSFDINGALLFENATISETNISRADALAQSDIVITGVPSEEFEKVQAAEIRPGTACINFSSVPNFDADINTHTDIYVPRVGPMTVAMCMRNALRLFKTFHKTE